MATGHNNATAIHATRIEVEIELERIISTQYAVKPQYLPASLTTRAGHSYARHVQYGSVPGRIRTCDLELRRLPLYPTELLGRRMQQFTKLREVRDA